MTKVAVIGAGYWGKNLMRTFHNLGCLAAVAEMNPTLAKDLRKQYPHIPIYHQCEDILDSSIPAVVIATPAETHYKLAEKALLAGKDVFVEKPMTLSVAEADRLQHLAERHKRILMVGHMLVYQPAIRWIKQYIDAGGIGKLHSLHQTRLKLGRVRSVENVLWSFGVHDLAVCLYIIGQEKPEVTISGHAMLRQQIEDDIYLHLRFDSNIQAHLHASWVWPFQDRRLIVIGSEGSLVYDELQQTVRLYRTFIDAEFQERDQGSELMFEGEAEPLKLECEHFIACLKERSSPLTGGSQGTSVIRIIEQAMIMVKEGVRSG